MTKIIKYDEREELIQKVAAKISSALITALDGRETITFAVPGGTTPGPILEKLSEIDGLEINKPEGAFYVFPDVSQFFNTTFGDRVIENSDDLCLYILDEAKVALVTGNAFGSPECVRISYAASMEELSEAMSRIKEALSKLA